MKSITRGKGRGVFEAAIAGTKADGDVVRLVITWQGNTVATLVAVRDDSVPVPIVATEGKGRIEVDFTAAGKGSHAIELDLEFPGKTLKKLKLTGRSNGSAVQDLDSKDEAKHRWGADGVLS